MVFPGKKNNFISKYIDFFVTERIENPKISVIIPAYNTEKYIEQCLGSVIRQTLKEIEILVIDDGSKDGTLDIIREFEKADKRVAVLTQENAGPSAARNRAIEVAKGEFISFVDADDWIDDNFLEKLYTKAVGNNCDIAAATIVRKRKNTQKYRVHYTEEKIYSSLKEKVDICKIPECCYIWNKIYKTDLVKQLKFKENVYFEDVIWLPQILDMSDKLITVPDTAYWYRVNQNSIVKKLCKKNNQTDSYEAKKFLLKYLSQRGINFSEKERTLTKKIKYFCTLPVIKLKELGNRKFYLLFGFIKIPYSICYKINIFLKQIFSINEFDGHKVIYILGILIRSKKKTKPPKISVTQYGLNKEPRDRRIIASLTSFPDRINTVKETVKTLLNQTCKPDELVLYLASKQFPNGENSLPQELLDLKKYGLSIKWCKDIKSYKKLIPALKEFPEDIIITFDDDVYYEGNIIELLYNSYLQDKNCIHANRGVRLVLKGNKIAILKNAVYYWHKFDDISYKNTIIGCGGVLYPPHSLSEEVFNEEKFMSTVPTQDDIWFWAMAVLNKTPIKIVASYDIKLITVENTQQYGLCKINHQSKKNGLKPVDEFNMLAEIYPEILQNMRNEND